MSPALTAMRAVSSNPSSKPWKGYSHTDHCKSTLYGNLVGAHGHALSVVMKRVECLASHQGVSVQRVARESAQSYRT